MLDFFETANQNAEANAVANPARTLETSAGEAFRTTWNANMRYRSLGAMARNTSDAAQEWLDGHEKLTGQKLENPYAAGGDFLTFDYQKYSDARKKVEEATQRFAIERNDPSYAFPDDQTLFRQGVKKGQAALQRAAEAGQVQQGFGSTLASLGAGFAAQFGDPADFALNAAAMAAIPAGGGMLRSALMAGTAFGAQEAVSGVANLPYQRQIDPTRGLGSVALESLEAAAVGVALDLGGHALGALWRRYVRKAPETAASLPQPVADAAIVAERAADLSAQNPFKGLQGEAAFSEAVPAVERALMNGEPVVLPEAAAQAAAARTGQVHAPVVPDASDLIDRQAGNPYFGERPAVAAPAPQAAAQPAPKQNRKARRAAAKETYDQASDRLRRADGDLARSPEIAAEIPPSPEEIATAKSAPIATNDRAFVGSRAVDVRYELAELGDLVGSHDRDFRVNPDYPAELQPRDRGSKAAREQVYDMAAKLEPERLGPSPEANSGAPIVGPDNVIESGNGRAMAIRAAYDMDGERAAAYRAWLERNGYETTGMKQPVLVARRTSPMSEAERADFAHAANGSASLRMNAVEQALSDARHITGELVDLLQKGMVDSAANRDFILALAAKMPQGERGGMVTATGQLSQSGVKRVQAALVARAYGDPGVVARAFDHAEPNIKTIAAALTEGAPEWIKMREAVARGEVAAGHDITDAVMTAVKTIMRARDEGEPVSRALAQGDFFASDTSGLAARLFFKDGSLTRFLSKKDMGDNLQTFAQAILEQRGKGDDLFGSPPPDTRQVLGNVAKLSDARQAQIAQALKPEVIEKAFADPKVHEAAEADLRRAIDQGKNRVPVEDADGNVTMGFADAELKRIDDEIAAAQELKACTTVQTEAAE